jgi:muramidase (phage lysozyme)
MYERREFFKVPSMPEGVDERAIQFVRDHMGEPSWKIHKQLRERRIKCSLQRVHRIWMAIRYLSLMA